MIMVNFHAFSFQLHVLVNDGCDTNILFSKLVKA